MLIFRGEARFFGFITAIRYNSAKSLSQLPFCDYRLKSMPFEAVLKFFLPALGVPGFTIDGLTEGLVYDIPRLFFQIFVLPPAIPAQQAQQQQNKNNQYDEKAHSLPLGWIF